MISNDVIVLSSFSINKNMKRRDAKVCVCKSNIRFQSCAVDLPCVCISSSPTLFLTFRPSTTSLTKQMREGLAQNGVDRVFPFSHNTAIGSRMYLL